jgi:predicted nucleic acid-binding protein
VAVNYAIDASSVINLNNVGALTLATKLANCKFWLSPIVVGECGPTCAADLLALRAAGAIAFVNDDAVPTQLFLSLLAEHQLGEGETETIAVCLALGYKLCCDDKRARTLAEGILGQNSVIGSLRILRCCVEQKLILCKEAFALFEAMRSAGGFLPKTAQTYF